MSLNWKELENNIIEIKIFVENSQLQKISQLDDLALNEGFVLRGYSPSKGSWRTAIILMDTYTGILSLNKEIKLKQSTDPNTFIMILRKHLLGERIHSLRQIEGERICWLEFSNGKILVLELMPRRANAILLESLDQKKLCGKSLGSFHRVSLSKGASYSLPKAKIFNVKEVRDFSEYKGKNFSERVSNYFYEKLKENNLNFKKKSILQIIKNELKKINTSIKKTKMGQKSENEIKEIKNKAFTLFENLYNLSKKPEPNENILKIKNPRSKKIVNIEIDTSLTYAENADALFKKVKKINRMEEKSVEFLKNLERKKEILEKIDLLAKEVTSSSMLESIENKISSISSLKYLLDKRKLIKRSTKKEEGDKNKPYLEVLSSDGFSILCGRNQTENREITFRAAKGNDLWMHVSKTGGSHVIIKSKKNKTIPLQTLLEAAQFALYYSKLRNSKKVEVDYTFRKNVKPIKGSISKVTYTGNKSLIVDSNPELMKKILRKNNI